MAEQVSRSIRADAEAFEKLKSICAEKGLKQGEAFEALLTAWEVQEAKGLVPERAADVADFDAHLQGIQKAFLRSLDLAQSAESRARIGYAAQLDAMSGTVARLEKELDAMRKANADLSERAERAEKRVAELETAQAERNSVQAILAALETHLSDLSADMGKDTPKPKNAAKGKKSGKTAKTETDDFQQWNNAEIAREEKAMENGENTIEFKAANN